MLWKGLQRAHVVLEVAARTSGAQLFESDSDVCERKESASSVEPENQVIGLSFPTC